jgi:hypothetical protein
MRGSERVICVWRLPFSQEISMSWFVVRFMKDVLGENGRQCEICQSTVEVDAASEDEAAEAAKQTFCRTQRLSDWSVHADRINVRAADFPS